MPELAEEAAIKQARLRVQQAENNLADAQLRLKEAEERCRRPLTEFKAAQAEAEALVADWPKGDES